MTDPINILIVDDEPKNLTVLESVLNDPAYRFVRATSTEQALLALVVEEFALLILDIRMPGMSGFELAHIIKERKKTAHIPIIFLSAYYSEDQFVLEGYGSGAVDYLHKPVNPVVLRSKVAVFAELHLMQRESAQANRALLAEVNERRRAEEQLRELNETLEQRVAERTETLHESEKRLVRAQRAAHVGTWEWDLVAGTGVWSEEAWSVFGRTPGEFAVTYENWLACVHPDDRGSAEAALDAASQTGRYRDEFRVFAPDDGVRWVESRGELTFNAAGQPVRMSGTMLDITARRLTDEVLARSFAGLERRVDERTLELRKALDSLEAEAVERKRLEEEVLQTAEQERLHIAADLHDGICQELVGVQFLAGALRRDLEKAHHPLAAQARRIVESMGEAVDHTREVARGMNPVVADGSGLMHALDKLAATTAKQHKIQCSLECPVPVSIECPKAANELYRIAQEAIRNAATHGGAKQISVCLGETDAETSLTVRDNGCGLPENVSNSTGMGLRVMKYRAGQIGGKIIINSEAHSGTEVICRIKKPSAKP